MEDLSLYGKMLFQELPVRQGCVGSRDCDFCGSRNSGTCMCIKHFTCKDCGQLNTQEPFVTISDIKKFEPEYFI